MKDEVFGSKLENSRIIWGWLHAGADNLRRMF